MLFRSAPHIAVGAQAITTTLSTTTSCAVEDYVTASGASSEVPSGSPGNFASDSHLGSPVGFPPGGLAFEANPQPGNSPEFPKFDSDAQSESRRDGSYVMYHQLLMNKHGVFGKLVPKELGQYYTTLNDDCGCIIGIPIVTDIYKCQCGLTDLVKVLTNDGVYCATCVPRLDVSSLVYTCDVCRVDLDLLRSESGEQPSFEDCLHRLTRLVSDCEPQMYSALTAPAELGRAATKVSEFFEQMDHGDVLGKMSQAVESLSRAGDNVSATMGSLNETVSGLKDSLTPGDKIAGAAQNMASKCGTMFEMIQSLLPKDNLGKFVAVLSSVLFLVASVAVETELVMAPKLKDIISKFRRLNGALQAFSTALLVVGLATLAKMVTAFVSVVSSTPFCSWIAERWGPRDYLPQSGGTSMVAVCTMAIAAVLDPYQSLDFRTLHGAAKNLPHVSKGFETIAEAISYMAQYLPTALIGWQAKGLPDFGDLAPRPRAVLNDVVATYFAAENAGDIGSDKYLAGEVLKAHANLAQIRIQLLGAKASGPVKQFVSDVSRGLEKYVRPSQLLLRASDSRPVPVGVYLQGDPGVGKTFVIHKLIGLITNTENPCYYRNASDKYWSKYNHQPTLVMEEAFATNEESSEQIGQFLTMMSNAPLSLQMADLSEKGRAFTSSLVFSTSNFSILGTPKIPYLRSTEAYLRRWHYVVQVKPARGFANKAGGLNLEKVKAQSEEDRNQFKHMLFYVYPFADGKRQAAVLMSFFELATVIRGTIFYERKQWEAQEDLDDGTRAAYRDWVRDNVDEAEQGEVFPDPPPTHIPPVNLTDGEFEAQSDVPPLADDEEFLTPCSSSSSSSSSSTKSEAIALDDVLSLSGSEEAISLAITSVDAYRASNRNVWLNEPLKGFDAALNPELTGQMEALYRKFAKLHVIPLTDYERLPQDVRIRLFVYAALTYPQVWGKTIECQPIEDGPKWRSKEEMFFAHNIVAGCKPSKIKVARHVHSHYLKLVKAVSTTKAPHMLWTRGVLHVLRWLGVSEDSLDTIYRDAVEATLSRSDPSKVLNGVLDEAEEDVILSNANVPTLSDCPTSVPATFLTDMMYHDSGGDVFEYKAATPKQFDLAVSLTMASRKFKDAFGFSFKSAMSWLGTISAFIGGLYATKKVMEVLAPPSTGGFNSDSSDSDNDFDYIDHSKKEPKGRRYDNRRANAKLRRRAATTKRSGYFAQSVGFNDQDVLSSIGSCVSSIRTPAGSANCVALSGLVYLTSKHLFHYSDGQSLTEGADVYLTINGKEHCLGYSEADFVTLCTEINGKVLPSDFVAFKAPAQCNRRKGILRFMVGDGSVSKLQSLENAVAITHRGVVDLGLATRINQVMEWSYNEHGPIMRSKSRYQYKSVLQPGDCMSPIVRRGSGDSKVVVGFHTMLWRSGNKGVAMAWDAEGITQVLSLFDDSASSLPVLPPIYEQEPQMVSEGLEYQGRILEPVVGMQKKTHKQYGILSETSLAGACDKQFVNLDPDTINEKMLEGIKKIAKPKGTFPRNIHVDIVDNLTDELRILKPSVEPRVLTESEAINGVDGMPRLDLSSGPGFPLKHKYPNGLKKRDFLANIGTEEEPCYEVDNQDLRQEIDEHLDFLKDGVPSYKASMVFPKDEVRSPAKVDKPRPVMADNFANTIVMRSYFGAFISSFFTNYPLFWSAVGMDTDGPDWNDMILYLKQVGTNGFDADVKAMDSTVHIQVAMGLLDAINTWYTAHSGHTDEEGNQVRALLMENVIYTPIVLGKDVYMKYNGNSSGCVLTTILNCYGVRYALMGAYLQTPMPVDLRGLHNFRNLVRTKGYGDDVIVCLSERVSPYFNGASYQQSMASLGIDIVRADKLEGEIPLKPIEECEFLAGTTVPVPEDLNLPPGISYLFKIQKESLGKPIRFVTDSISRVEASITNANGALRRLLPYGKAYFTQVRDEFLAAFKAHDIEPNLVMWGDVLAFYSSKVDVHSAKSLKLEGCEPQGQCEFEPQSEPVQILDSTASSTTQPSLRAKPGPGELAADEVSFNYQTVLSRDQYIGEVNWPGGQQFLLLKSWLAPWDLMGGPALKAVETFHYFRSDMIVTFQVQGTMFHAGCLVAYFVPLTNPSDAQSVHGAHPQSWTLLNHCFLYANDSNSVSLRIPYTHYKDLLDYTNPEDFLGTLRLEVLNPVVTGEGGITDLTVSVFARFENSLLKVLRKNVVSIPTRTIQMTALPKVVNSYKPKVLDPADVQAQGMVTSKVVNIDKVVNSTVDVRNRDEFDQEVGVDAINDAPNLGVNPMPIVNRSVPFMNHGNNIRYANVMSLNPGTDPQATADTFCSDLEEIRLSKMLQAFTYLSTFTWSDSDQVGKQFVFPLTPVPNLYGASLGQVITPTWLEYWSRLYRRWTGSLRFKFQIIAPTPTTGRFAIVSGLGQESPAVDLETNMAQYATVCDIKSDEKVYSFEIEYRAPTQSLRIHNGGNFDFQEEIMGTLSFVVLNRLKTMQSTANFVEVNVYMAAGEDFRLMDYGFNNETLIPFTPLDVPFEGDFVPQMDVTPPPVNINDEVPTADVGPVPMNMTPMPATEPQGPSILALAKRYALISEIDAAIETVTTFPVAELMTQWQTHNAAHTIPTPMSGITLPYRMWFGSLRFMVICPRQCEVEVRFTGGSKTPPTMFERSELPFNLESSRQPFDQNGDVRIISIQVPFVTHFRALLLPKTAAAFNVADILKYNSGHLAVKVKYPGPINTKVRIYGAFSDTTRVGIKWTVPRLKVSSVPIAPDRYTDPGETIEIPATIRIISTIEDPVIDFDPQDRFALIAYDDILPVGQISSFNEMTFDATKLSRATLIDLGFNVTPNSTLVYTGSPGVFLRSLSRAVAVAEEVTLTLDRSAPTPLKILNYPGILVNPVVIDGEDVGEAYAINSAAWSTVGVFETLWPKIPTGLVPFPVVSFSGTAVRSARAETLPSLPPGEFVSQINDERPPIYLVLN